MNKLLFSLTILSSITSYAANYSCNYVAGSNLSRGKTKITTSKTGHEYLITSRLGKDYYLMDNGSMAGIVVKDSKTIVTSLASSGTRVISFRESLDSGNGTEVGSAELFVACIRY